MRQSLFRRSAAVFDPRHYGFLASTIRQHSYNWEHYTIHPSSSLPTTYSTTSSSTSFTNLKGPNSEGYVPDYPVDVILHYRANGIPLTDIIRDILPMLLAEDPTLIERILPPSVSHVCTTTTTTTTTNTHTNGHIGVVQGSGSRVKSVVSISGDLTAETPSTSASTSLVKGIADTGTGAGAVQQVKPSGDDVYTHIIKFIFPPADPDPHNTLLNTTTSQGQAMKANATSDLTHTLTSTHAPSLATGPIPSKSSAQKRDSHYTASSSSSSSCGVGGGGKEGEMSPRIQQGQKRHKASNSSPTHQISSPLRISPITTADGADLEKGHNSDLLDSSAATCEVELSSKEWRIFALCEVYKLANDAKMVRKLYTLITYVHAVRSMTYAYYCICLYHTLSYFTQHVYSKATSVYSGQQAKRLYSITTEH